MPSPDISRGLPGNGGTRQDRGSSNGRATCRNRSLSFVGLPSINSRGPSLSCFVLSSASLLWTALVRDTALHVSPQPPACPGVTLHGPPAAADCRRSR